MKKICSSRPVLALGGLVAAAALLAGVPHAQAQAPAPGAALSGAGSFPNSFIVPGTNTSLHVGGFVELDTYYDTSAFGNASSIGAIDNFGVTSTELEGTGIAGNPAGHTNHGAWRWTAQNSRVDLETRTPSPYGEIKTFIEMDFGGSVGSLSGVNGTATAATGTLSAPVSQFTGARLKQAYGTLGPWLFGQAASNFADLAAWPDTLDAPVEAGGEMGVAEFRQPQIRYTQLFPGGISASGSVESFASSGEFATAHSGAGPVNWNDFNSSSFSERLPALTGTVRIDQPWGHAAFHVAVAEEEFRSSRSEFRPPARSHRHDPSERRPSLGVGLSDQLYRSLEHDRQGQVHLAIGVWPGRLAIHLGGKRFRHAMGRRPDLLGDGGDQLGRLLAAARHGRQCRLLALVDRHVAQRPRLRL